MEPVRAVNWATNSAYWLGARPKDLALQSGEGQVEFTVHVCKVSKQLKLVTLNLSFIHFIKNLQASTRFLG